MADEKKPVSTLPSGLISSNDDILMFVSGGITKKITWADIIDRIINTHITNGANVTLTRSNHTLTISSSGGGGGSGQEFYISDTEPDNPAENDIWLHTDVSNYGDLDVYESGEWVTKANMKGADGDDGQPGQDGAAATISVGTVTTGAAGTNASITNSGTTSAAVFDFVIPKGADGTNGTNGTDGDSISAEVTSITGGHRVTISHTDETKTDQIFDVMDGTEIIQTSSDNRQITLLAADWVGSSAPYTQTVSVLGMIASVVPIIGLVTSSTVSTGVEEQKQWSYITKAVSGADSITFSCYKTKPTIDLTANVKAV